MADYLVSDEELTSIADAIRTKGGTSDPLTWPDEYVDAIGAISGGGGGSMQSKTATPTESTQTIQPDTGYDGLSSVTVNPIPSQYIVPTGTKSITANGTGIDVTEYAAVDVAVPSSAPTLQSKSATPTETAQTVTPDSGYDGLSSVSVGAISSTYVGSGITRRSSSDLTVSTHTVTAPAGYYESDASRMVALGGVQTPTISAGTVFKHAIKLSPFVTYSTGYIWGGNMTGEQMTISASDLVSGSQTITSNNTYDVTNLAQVVVNVASPVKTATGTFTGNGTRTIDVTCAFEPDLVYFTSDPGTTASSGTVAAIIVRDMMTATRYRNNATTNSHYAIPDIADLNSSGSSYSWRATYADSKVTLYCYSSNARGLLTNGRTYSYTFMKWT